MVWNTAAAAAAARRMEWTPQSDGGRDGGRGVAELARSEIAGGGGVGRFEAC